MIERQLITVALWAVTAGLAQGADTGKTDPESGKRCVSLLSAERVDGGLMRMNYRNICDSPFQIEIMARNVKRTGSIKAGTPKKPSTGYILCKSADECDVASWKYE